MQRYCLTLDLKDDEEAIAEYKRHHEKIWPEIKQSILEAGVTAMEIYLLGTRLIMIMEVSDSFSLAEKENADAQNPKVQEWETLMRRFQQQLPGAAPGQWWTLTEKIFSLKEQ
jgi:L-rhamnose mutarotase